MRRNEGEGEQACGKLKSKEKDGRNETTVDEIL